MGTLGFWYQIKQTSGEGPTTSIGEISVYSAEFHRRGVHRQYGGQSIPTLAQAAFTASRTS